MYADCAIHAHQLSPSVTFNVIRNHSRTRFSPMRKRQLCRRPVSVRPFFCPSVCLSHSCISSRPGSPIILVFWPRASVPNPHGGAWFRWSATPLHLHKCVARFVSDCWVSSEQLLRRTISPDMSITPLWNQLCKVHFNWWLRLCSSLMVLYIMLYSLLQLLSSYFSLLLSACQWSSGPLLF